MNIMKSKSLICQLGLKSNVWNEMSVDLISKSQIDSLEFVCRLLFAVHLTFGVASTRVMCKLRTTNNAVGMKFLVFWSLLGAEYHHHHFIAIEIGQTFQFSFGTSLLPYTIYHHFTPTSQYWHNITRQIHYVCLFISCIPHGHMKYRYKNGILMREIAAKIKWRKKNGQWKRMEKDRKWMKSIWINIMHCCKTWLTHMKRKYTIKYMLRIEKSPRYYVNDNE